MLHQKLVSVFYLLRSKVNVKKLYRQGPFKIKITSTGLIDLGTNVCSQLNYYK